MISGFMKNKIQEIEHDGDNEICCFNEEARWDDIHLRPPEVEACWAYSRNSRQTGMTKAEWQKGKGQNGAESSKSTGNEGEDPEGRVGHARILHFTLSEMGNLWRVLNTCDLKGFLLFVINNSEYFIFPLLIFGVIHNFIPYPFHK